jgi:hypothetical protein
MTSRGKPWINRAGFALGVVLAAGIVAAGKVPDGDRPVDARLTIAATATGGLAAFPEGEVLAPRRLAPGSPAARARVSLLNQTSGTVQVLVRAEAGDRALDDAVHLKLRPVHGRPLRTTLGELRRWRPLGRALPAHGREAVRIEVRIPASADGAAGRRSEVSLEFLRKGAHT